MRTGNFNIDTYSPICMSFGTVDIQVAQPYFLDAFYNIPRLLVARHSRLLAGSWLVRVIEGVEEVKMPVL